MGWMIGDENHIEMKDLKEIDVDELIEVSFEDPGTTYELIEKLDEGTIQSVYPFTFGFLFNFDEKDEDIVYLIPYAKITDYRKFDTSLYDLEEVHSYLKEEAEKRNKECKQYHDEPAVYMTYISYTPIHFEKGASLSTLLQLAAAELETVYKKAIVRSIDKTIEGLYDLRKQYQVDKAN